MRYDFKLNFTLKKKAFGKSLLIKHMKTMGSLFLICLNLVALL